MRYYIYTTGCRSNQFDSYVIEERLRGIGIPSSFEEAEIVVVNACTVTSNAERDVRRFVERARKKRKEAFIVLTGCHPQVYEERNFGSDLVLGQKEKFEIDKYLGRRGIFVEKGRDFPMEELETLNSNGKTRFFLKIQDGCDNFCSFCVVPYARGRKRSRPYKEIKGLMRKLKEKGVKEVVLTGIEIAAYRDGDLDLKTLLKRLENDETPERIRLSSIDPLFIDEEFVKILKDSKKILKSLHIPLQSASDRVLERMGRRYKKGEIEEKIEYILREIEGVGIGLDILTGFPNEDEKAFNETRDFIESKDLYYLHVFPFSKREKTEAFSFQDLNEEIKRKRAKILKEIDFKKRMNFYRRFIGKEFSVLFEGKIYKKGLLRGYTENYIPVYVPYEEGLSNRILKVKIKGIVEGMPFGEIRDSHDH